MGYDARFGYCTAFLGRWVRDYGIMNLEEAVAKLTFRVASVFGLSDRGLSAAWTRRRYRGVRSGDDQYAGARVRSRFARRRNPHDPKSHGGAVHGGQR